jgi:hypothetical protein
MDMKAGLEFSADDEPAIPADFALRTSSGLRSGERYKVIRNSISGAIFSSVALYFSACSVVVIGGVRFGW